MSHGELASWGSGERNDWAVAAERAGNLILGECTILHLPNTLYLTTELYYLQN
jgi:hypothetical protein